MKKKYPLSKVYSLLEPGPVVLVSSAHKGRANVMAMSWHTMIDFDPPLVGCVIGDRSYSSGLIKASKECVINIPTLELAKKTVACGNVSGRTVDKFAEFGLTPEKASLVEAPLIKECYASLECRLRDPSLAGKYDLLIFEVVRAWVDTAVKAPKTLHHRGGEAFMAAGRTLRIPSRMA